MNKVRKQSRPRYASAVDWPAWTDQVAYVPTAAEHDDHAAMNATWDDHGPDADDPVWDEWAGEALALDQLERGLRMF